MWMQLNRLDLYLSFFKHMTSKFMLARKLIRGIFLKTDVFSGVIKSTVTIKVIC